jgi:hypothetical protein
MRQAMIAAGMAASLLWTGVAAAQVGPPRPGPRCLPGVYDGGQTELATRLSLGHDHRFRYMLSYGALDESAEGRWEEDGGRVLLSSDPVTAPAFALVSQKMAPTGRISIALDTPPGISPQYFSALIRFFDGRSEVRQLSDEGLVVEIGSGEKPKTVSLLLAILDLESPSFDLAGGDALHLRFDPNDLGKVAFDRAPLTIDREDLLLDRHDRHIRFRRDGGCEASGGRD